MPENTEPVEILLPRLEGVVDHGNGRWTTRCPAHEDKSPSLSIRDTGGRVLIHCHAGCSAESVLSALGLTFADLYSSTERAAYAAATAFQGHRRKDPPFDPGHERMVLRLAKTDIKAGKTLSMEDRARANVAHLRIASMGSNRS